MKFRLLCLLLVAMLCGCRAAPPSPLPRFENLSEEQRTQIINDRAAALSSVQASATVRLTDAKGQEVSLDAALVAERPAKLRLRTWKLGQAVFDMTILHDEAWVWVGRDEAWDASRLTRDMLSQWPSYFFEGRPETTAKAGSAKRTYDPRTLVLTRVDIQGGKAARIVFSDYRMIAGLPWPMSVSVIRDGAVIEVQFADVTLNEPLPPKAFNPPARAKRLP